MTDFQTNTGEKDHHQKSRPKDLLPSHPKHDLVILIPRWKFDQSQPRRSFVNSDAFKASCIGIVNWINILTFVKPHGINCNWNGMLFSEPRDFINRFHLGFVTTLGWMFCPCAIPNRDILIALEEAVRSYAEALIRYDHKIHLKRSYVNHQLDHRHNHDRAAYTAIREPPHQHIKSLRTQYTLAARVIECDEFDVAVALENSFKLTNGCDVEIKSHFVYPQLGRKMNLVFLTKENPTEHPEFDLHEAVQLQISYDGMQPQDIHAALAQYWEPIWQRDTDAEATDWNQWTDFQNRLQESDLPQLCSTFDITSEATWQTVISQLNGHLHREQTGGTLQNSRLYLHMPFVI